VHVVWEITLACDLKCLHCCSRAGQKRERELTTAECLDVVSALARLSAREVTLIGGEAYLRNDWIEIVRAVRAHGMRCAIQIAAVPPAAASSGRNQAALIKVSGKAMRGAAKPSNTILREAVSGSKEKPLTK